MNKKQSRQTGRKLVKVVKVTPADRNNVVVSIEGGGGEYQKAPCAQCPWRVDQTGSFPKEAFRISANTATDMSNHMFACHMAGKENPRTCAGFILNGSADNLAVRFKRGESLMLDVTDGGHALHGSYKKMAVANGCSEDDPALAQCMPEAREAFWQSKRTPPKRLLQKRNKKV